MTLHTETVYLRPLGMDDAAELLELRLRNHAFLQPFEPIRSSSFLTLTGQQEQIAQAEKDFAAGTGYAFGVFLRETDDMIGRVALSNVVRGAWQNATIGYFMDQSCNQKGYTTAAVRLALAFAFQEAGLHRVQAAVMPRNTASIRVLEKNGFRKEGLSLHYLQINGVWEDHLIFALTAEDLA
ncbi:MULTISPECIES: GNAT family N-acetyltransferase [Brevibacillus]|uniref:GNAT family N-acetyltransferase n=1 Tax=Brevibacillus TaxID=55080 RepID=UPI000EC88CC2|nr:MULTISPECIES: GNAT family protein [Brevibacillus]MBU8711737.1 GNAT family N-acetyltransferase [Brevibacillus parabrevis]MDH6349634.1 ribosomal-protein-alanine N-acetyltransferase [Brevibacillus sp. 1238]MDR4999089.1 GNAT family protein [Brevibacillus parabrevis]MED2254354.1 GNAT family protein [Brevibacillus parabrevis]NRQ54629.1 GNAT family N-acetyltransferase [Brevibacillus sp. HD1.4A]